MMTVRELYGGYGDGFQIKNVNFHVNEGDFFGIIGPNGSGKTTLVKMISGILSYEKGSIYISDEELRAFRPKNLAKKIAVLPQLTEHTFQYTVAETVALGRYAHQSGLFPTFTIRDKEIINEVMEKTDVKRYEHVTLDQLSGGEKQRVFLAQALAQQPEIIILDEPTNHLDLAYQKELLDLLKSYTTEKKLTVIAIFHDLNLASLYCERLLLLHEGAVKICGSPQQVLMNDTILSVYETEVEKRDHPQVPKPQIMLNPKPALNCAIDFKNVKLTEYDDKVIFHAPFPLKTIATNVIGSANGWFENFVHYYASESIDDSESKAQTLITVNGKRRFTKKIILQDTSFYIVLHQSNSTFILWIFIDGILSEDAFLDALVTVTEAKTVAYQSANNIRSKSADSIVIASTQTGAHIDHLQANSDIGKALVDVVREMVELSLSAYVEKLTV